MPAAKPFNWPLVLGLPSMIMGIITILTIVWGWAIVPLQAVIAKDEIAIENLTTTLRAVQIASEASKQADIESRSDRAQTDARGKQTNDTLAKLSADFESAEATNRALVAEVETQFKAVSIVVNDQQAYTQQMLSVLFGKAFPGSTLTPMTYRPQLNK